MLSLHPRERKKWILCLLTAVFALPLGYFLVSWSIHVYSFFTLYRPEKIFHESPDPADVAAEKGPGILEALNAEIQEENSARQGEEGWLLARVDRLWRSVRRYVAPAVHRQAPASAKPMPPAVAHSRSRRPTAPRTPPPTSPDVDKTVRRLQKVPPLATQAEVFKGIVKARDPLPAVSSKSLDPLATERRRKTAESLYRVQSLKGLRTESVIYHLNHRLTFEGTIEAKPEAETDPDLSDFSFRTVHALSFLENRTGPSIMTDYQGVHSGYPLSYGLGLNYQVSPVVTLQFDYSYESPNDYLVEYNGTWESSLMNNYRKKRQDNPFSVHSFFLGLRYLCRKENAQIPLHTGFFYSTNMDDDPLLSNVSLGFTIGGGINRRNLSLGLAWRFRVWDNPDPRFPDEQQMQELQTRVANQFLFTLLF